MEQQFNAHTNKSEALALFQTFSSNAFKKVKNLSDDKINKQIDSCTRKISRWALLSLIVISAIFISTGCAKHSDKSEHPIISNIEIQQVVKKPTNSFYTTSATVKAKTNSVVASMIMGKVASIAVQEGDSVKAGQLLLTIDSRDAAQKAIGAKAGVKMAQMAANSAAENMKMSQRTYSRYKNLYSEKVITKQEFDQYTTQKNVAATEYKRAQAAVDQAKAGLSEARVYQGYSRVKAPVSGIVTKKNVDLGSTAIQGQPLLTIESPADMELVANIDESYLGKVSSGQVVLLEVGETTLNSEITKVISSINPTTRTFKARIDIKGLAGGQFVKINIPVSTKDSIIIPQNAVVKKGELTGVYTVDEENIISYRLIRTGRAFAGEVEVLSGLSDEDRIVAGGIDNVIDGGKLKVEDNE